MLQSHFRIFTAIPLIYFSAAMIFICGGATVFAGEEILEKPTSVDVKPQRKGRRYELHELPGYKADKSRDQRDDKKQPAITQKKATHRHGLSQGERGMKDKGHALQKVTNGQPHPKNAGNTDSSVTSPHIGNGSYPRTAHGPFAGPNWNKPKPLGQVVSTGRNFHGGRSSAKGVGVTKVDLGCPWSDTPSVWGTNVVRSMACVRCTMEQRQRVSAPTKRHKMSLRWQSLMTVMAHRCGAIKRSGPSQPAKNHTAQRAFEIAEALGYCNPETADYEWTNGADDADTFSMRNISSLLQDTGGVRGSLAAVAADWEQGGVRKSDSKVDGEFYDNWFGLGDDSSHRFKKIYGIAYADLAKHLGCEEGGPINASASSREILQKLQNRVIESNFASGLPSVLQACAQEASDNVKRWHRGTGGFCAKSELVKRSKSNRLALDGAGVKRVSRVIEGGKGLYPAVGYFPYTVIDTYSGPTSHDPICYVPAYQVKSHKEGAATATYFADPFTQKEGAGDSQVGSRPWRVITGKLPDLDQYFVPSKKIAGGKRPLLAKKKLVNAIYSNIVWQGWKFSKDSSSADFSGLGKTSVISFNGQCLN